MAVIEDEFLSNLFQRAADSFEVPETGVEDILRRAKGFEAIPVDESDDDDRGMPAVQPLSTVRRFRNVAGQHRILTAAAAVVVIAAVGTAAALLSGSSTPNRPVTSAIAGSTVTSTTTLHAGDSTPLLAPAGTGFAASGAASKATNGAGTTTGAAASTPSSGGAVPQSGITPAATSAPSTSNGAVAAQPARIEQTGTLTLKVGRHSLSTTMTKLTFLATASGGFVANSQTQSGQGSAATGTVTLQVPVGSFSTVLKDAQALGTTEQISTKATDVTSQYVNLQEQITALQASQQQYLLIMTKATTIGDILSVEAQLSSLATQIDQLQGQENLLNSETTYSTLTVTVTVATTHHHHVSPPHPRTGLSKAWHDSLHGFAAGVDGLVRIAGPVIFGLLCLAVLLVLGRLSWRRYQRHRL
jgi:Domain of unknown function (DUF4349)